MASTIITKYGSGAPLASDVVRGELAVDTENKRLYTEDSGGSVVEIGTNPTTLAVDTDTLVVDAANNRVGIGTTSPASLLHLSAASPAIRIVGTADSSIILQDTGASTNQQAAQIVNNGGTLTFRSLNDALTGVVTTAMTIENLTGNVGIGTSSPNTKLVLSANNGGGAENNTLRFEDTDTATGTNQVTGKIEFYSSDTTNTGVHSFISGVTKNTTAIGELVFATGVAGSASEAMRITSGGNVGIGNDSPGVKLEVSNGSDSDLVMMIRGADNTTEYMALGVNGSNGVLTAGASGSESTNMVFRTASSGTEAEAMRIDSSGSVGIGGITPTGLLTLGTGTFSAAAANTSALYTSTTAGLVAVADGLLLVDRAGADVFKVDTSGNVGIGTEATTLEEALTVHRSGSTSSFLQFTNGNTGQANNNGLYVGVNTSGTAYIGLRDTNDRDLLFQTNNSEAMRIDSSGRLLINTTSETTPGNNSAYLIVESDAGSSQEGIYIRSDGGIGDPAFVVGDASNVAQLNIFGDGDVENTNGTYGTISDARVKENITDAASQWEDFKAIRIRRYNLISKPNEPHIGVIAQELEEAGIGGLVKDTRQDGMKSVKTSILYMKAIKALQEAMERIETLEAKVAQLEGAN